MSWMSFTFPAPAKSNPINKSSSAVPPSPVSQEPKPGANSPATDLYSKDPKLSTKRPADKAQLGGLQAPRVVLAEYFFSNPPVDAKEIRRRLIAATTENERSSIDNVPTEKWKRLKTPEITEVLKAVKTFDDFKYIIEEKIDRNEWQGFNDAEALSVFLNRYDEHQEEIIVALLTNEFWLQLDSAGFLKFADDLSETTAPKAIDRWGWLGLERKLAVKDLLPIMRALKPPEHPQDEDALYNITDTIDNPQNLFLSFVGSETWKSISLDTLESILAEFDAKLEGLQLYYQRYGNETYGYPAVHQHARESAIHSWLRTRARKPFLTDDDRFGMFSNVPGLRPEPFEEINEIISTLKRLRRDGPIPTRDQNINYYYPKDPPYEVEFINLLFSNQPELLDYIKIEDLQSITEALMSDPKALHAFMMEWQHALDVQAL
ncbi:MAG: hypothetical protein R3C68_18580 [Myxococcota bacterium]